ncbi:MAG: hypothetical protein WEB58_10905 [Planctomycetaceae bacterium]
MNNARIYTLPALVGHDHERHIGEIVVSVDAGNLIAAASGQPLIVEPGGELKGRGRLDGESYAVKAADWSHPVNVETAPPSDPLWRRLASLWPRCDERARRELLRLAEDAAQRKPDAWRIDIRKPKPVSTG